MTVQDLYDVISDISTQDVKLYFVTRKTKENITKKMRAKDKYLFRVYQIDCDDELRETILSASKEQLKATIDKNFDLVDYDILSDETENLFTYSIKNKVFSFSDVVTNQLLSTNIEKVKNLFDITSNGDSLWAYCVEFFNLSTKQKIYTFRKLLPSKVCVDEKSTKWLRAMFSTKSQKLTILKEETVMYLKKPILSKYWACMKSIKRKLQRLQIRWLTVEILLVQKNF